MMSAHAALLLVVVLTGAQDSAEEPEARKHYTEAANAAFEAGDYGKAEALLAQTVREAAALGGDDLRQVQPIERLARFYLMKEVHRAADAEPLLRRALAIQEKAKGGEHADVAEGLLKLALCRMQRGKEGLEEADRLQQRALAILEKARGKDDLSIAIALYQLGLGRLMTKQFDKAKPEFTRAIAIREKALGPDNAELASVLEALGDVDMARLMPFAIIRPAINSKYLTIEDPFQSAIERLGRQAETFYKRALAIRAKTAEANDPDLADTLGKLAQVAMLRNQPGDGEPYATRWSAIHERIRRGPTAGHAAILRIWAEAARQREDWVEAERRLAQAQAVQENVEGAKSDEVAALLASRADVATAAGRFDDAETLLKRALALQAELIGPRDPSVRRAQELMRGRYQDHASHPLGYRLWRQLREFSDQQRDQESAHLGLATIADCYSLLLRRTNRAVPMPTEDDLKYLRKLGATSCIRCGDLVEVRTLDGNIEVDDERLSHMARMYGLETLFLHGGQVTDAGIAYLRNLGSLRQLYIFFEPISDAGLAQIADLESLEELGLDFTLVTDAGLVHLKRMNKLRSLTMRASKISDAGLEQLKALRNIRQLDISGKKITPAAVARLRRERPDLKIQYPLDSAAPSAVAAPPTVAAPSAVAPPAAAATTKPQ